MQADERNRISERKEVELFNYEAFHEAIINAFVHNKWLILNGPAINIFTNRIEILSHGGLPLDQDETGFYSGSSIPVNEILASIFLQLRISERTGRGVPKIVGCYGKEAIKIEKNRIMVTIPFNKININSFKIDGNKDNVKINKTQKKMLELISDNPYITINQFSNQLGLSEPGIKKNLKILKSIGMLVRCGSNKSGCWEIVQ
jgi:predicted HTH transcriptional regulator